jgi:glutamine synthetase
MLVPIIYFINYKRIVHTKISSTQPVYSHVQRSDMFRLSQSHSQAIDF